MRYEVLVVPLSSTTAIGAMSSCVHAASQNKICNVPFIPSDTANVALLCQVHAANHCPKSC